MKGLGRKEASDAGLFKVCLSLINSLREAKEKHEDPQGVWIAQ
jgi:hypothetical protein